MVRVAPHVPVVDDDLPICELLELAFTEAGWDVRVRTRGQDALAHLQKWTADVILLDLLMPEMDAEAFLSRCRVETGGAGDTRPSAVYVLKLRSIWNATRCDGRAGATVRHRRAVLDRATGRG
jgi:DNA-binding response OmpR family regulator